MKGYDTAQICLNGHVTNIAMGILPHLNAAFCDRCGQPTIFMCPNCQEPIRGTPNDRIIPNYSTPTFCRGCGKPYPWTEATLKAAHDLADEIDSLSAEEREILKASVNDIVIDTPQTQAAATRFRKLVAKAGKITADSFKQLLIGVAVEAAKKVIWPIP